MKKFVELWVEDYNEDENATRSFSPGLFSLDEIFRINGSDTPGLCLVHFKDGKRIVVQGKYRDLAEALQGESL